MARTTCRHPDHDNPKIVCGYPLPCPYHAAILNLDAKPVPTITIPITADAALRERDRLAGIGLALRPVRKRKGKR